MKTEDVWMVVLVGFVIVWVSAFGMGFFG